MYFAFFSTKMRTYGDKIGGILSWLFYRDTLMSTAKHYETGENLPEEVCLKLFSVRIFHAGSEMLH